MKKYEVLSKLIKNGIVAVIRGNSTTSLHPIISAIKVGGISSIEITCTVPNADILIKEVKENDEDLLIGAGTVLDSQTARLCIMRGASFIVSPQFSPSVAEICNLYGVPYIPGVASANEITHALKSGCSLLKLFPASQFSPTIIKDFLAPFPNVSFMPTGGISLNNVADWIRAGATVVGVGGILTKGAKNDDYLKIKETSHLFVDEINKARSDMEAV